MKWNEMSLIHPSSCNMMPMSHGENDDTEDWGHSEGKAACKWEANGTMQRKEQMQPVVSVLVTLLSRRYAEDMLLTSLRQMIERRRHLYPEAEGLLSLPVPGVVWNWGALQVIFYVWEFPSLQITQKKNYVDSKLFL